MSEHLPSAEGIAAADRVMVQFSGALITAKHSAESQKHGAYLAVIAHLRNVAAHLGFDIVVAK